MATDGQIGYHDLERMALGFILEDESWPVFLDWARANHVSGAAHDWLAGVPDVDEYRRQYLAHSPDPALRAMAGDGE
jgi:hypothetical protein